MKSKAKREDRELQEKLEKQQAEVPTSLDGFRYAFSLLVLSNCQTFAHLPDPSTVYYTCIETQGMILSFGFISRGALA